MKRKYWTKDLCKLEANKYMTRNEFAKNSSGAYAVSLKNNWINSFY